MIHIDPDTYQPHQNPRPTPKHFWHLLPQMFATTHLYLALDDLRGQGTFHFRKNCKTNSNWRPLLAETTKLLSSWIICLSLHKMFHIHFCFALACSCILPSRLGCRKIVIFLYFWYVFCLYIILSLICIHNPPPPLHFLSLSCHLCLILIW